MPKTYGIYEIPCSAGVLKITSILIDDLKKSSEVRQNFIFSNQQLGQDFFDSFHKVTGFDLLKSQYNRNGANE